MSSYDQLCAAMFVNYYDLLSRTKISLHREQNYLEIVCSGTLQEGMFWGFLMNMDAQLGNVVEPPTCKTDGTVYSSLVKGWKSC